MVAASHAHRDEGGTHVIYVQLEYPFLTARPLFVCPQYCKIHWKKPAAMTMTSYYPPTEGTTMIARGAAPGRSVSQAREFLMSAGDADNVRGLLIV